MQKTRNLIIAVIVFLIGLIVIQFIWILQAATNQEKQFEFAVVFAINKAVKELDKRTDICTGVIDCFDEKGFNSCNKLDLRKDLWLYIDSIIKNELLFNKIYIDYELQLSTEPHPHPILNTKGEKHKCFVVKSLMETSNNKNIYLHITFPEHNKFIIAQIGWLFIISITLILLTLGAFIFIYRYYKSEQMLAADTRNFINNLTHEFKTPLASIRLANSRIMKLDDCKDKTAAYTKIIHQENNKLDEHINYLLDISRLQKGKMPFNLQLINIIEMVKNQTNSFLLQIEERQGILKINNTATQVWVEADCFHFSNAITNILDNACKYTVEAPEISISIYNQDQSVVIAISDNGIGIEKKDQKTIFQEFSRVNTGNIHNIKGFGLGLAYVGEVVKLHNGFLWLESNPGLGSTFFIKLPIAKNSESV